MRTIRPVIFKTSIYCLLTRWLQRTQTSPSSNRMHCEWSFRRRGENSEAKQAKKRIIPNVYDGMMWPSWWNNFSSVLYKSDVSPKSTWRRLWQGGERLPKPNHCESATGLSRDVVAVSRSQDGCMELIIRALHVKTFEKTNKKSIHFASSNKHWITIDWKSSRYPPESMKLILKLIFLFLCNTRQIYKKSSLENGTW